MKHLRQGGFLIAKIHQIFGRLFSKTLKEHDIDINPAQGRILFPLWRKDSMTINELARETALGKSTLTSMLDRLESSGHLRRIPSTADRRKISIEVTETSMEMKKKYEDVSKAMIDTYYAGFSEKEIDEFEKYLERILQNLTR